MVRFSPEYEVAHEQVKNGAIGRAGVIRLRRSAVASAMNDADTCLFQQIGLREFDWLRGTFGEVERVMAREVKCETVHYALVMLRMAGGAIAHVELELSGSEVTEHTAYELTGDQGMLSHDSRESTPIRWSGGQLPLVTGILEWDSTCLNAHDLRAALEIAAAARESVVTGQPVKLLHGGEEG
ncbi:hypothetical protein [Brevibacillus sp. 179-C 1.1 NHS]|uniref:hypothetical protein n=1 Tax=Brevibacillus sp. 179-C 1.1 NHS TaxID=3235177 RepID=UPI0039A1A44C